MDTTVRAGVYVTIPGDKAVPLPKVGEGGSGVAHRVKLQQPIQGSSAIMFVMPQSLTATGPESRVTAEGVIFALIRVALESLALLLLGGAPAFASGCVIAPSCVSPHLLLGPISSGRLESAPARWP